MEKNEKQMDTSEEVGMLHQRVLELEKMVSTLEHNVKKAEDSMDHTLLKQIEILAVFAVFISLAITNVIGINVLGSMGLRGIAVIDFGYVVSAFILLLGIKFIIVGTKKK